MDIYDFFIYLIIRRNVVLRRFHNICKKTFICTDVTIKRSDIRRHRVHRQACSPRDGQAVEQATRADVGYSGPLALPPRGRAEPYCSTDWWGTDLILRYQELLKRILPYHTIPYYHSHRFFAQLSFIQLCAQKKNPWSHCFIRSRKATVYVVCFFL